RRLPRAAGRRRRDDGSGRAGDVVSRFSSGRAAPRVEHPDRADNAGPGAWPGHRGPARDGIVLAMGFLRERAAGHTRHRLRRAIPAGRERAAAGPFDTAGFMLAGASLGLLMYGVSEGPIRHWSSDIVQAAIAAGAILLL